MVELSAGASIALGVIVGLLSTCVQSVGLTLQRKSHLLEDEKEELHLRRPPYRRRRWQVGMLMFLVANLVGSTIQITTLPLPVLSTLQASGLVFNTICATMILGEPFTRYSACGTFLVAAGAGLIGSFGAISEPSHNLDQLLQLLGRRNFLIWLFSTFFVVALIILATFALKRSGAHHTPRMRLLRGMCFGCISSILCGHTLLIAKSAVELIIRTIVDRHNQFNRWQSWMILLGLVALGLSQLYYLHRGLKLCSTSVLYPFVFCIYNIVAILDGLIYFHQTSRLPVSHAVLIAVGTLILLSGVLALSWRLESEDRSPESPGASRKGKARVATPQTGLAPGLGFVSSMPEDEETSPFLGPLRPGDEEALVEARQRSPTEATPLLQTSTTPGSDVPRIKKRPPRPRHGRRLSIPEEADEIWEELNDRDGYRRSSGSMSLASPSLPKSRAGKMPFRRSRAGTLPVRRESRVALPGLQWPPFLERSKRRRTDSPVHQSQPPDGEGDYTTDGDDAVSPRPSGSRRRSMPATPRQEAVGGWFKLKWWKKRWRDEYGSDRGEDAVT